MARPESIIKNITDIKTSNFQVQIDQLQTEVEELTKRLKGRDEIFNREHDKTVELQAELEKLKEFARYIIETECWAIFDLDGGDIQDLAEKLGLIEPHIVTEEDVDEATDYEVGDTIYRFTETLKGK